MTDPTLPTEPLAPQPAPIPQPVAVAQPVPMAQPQRHALPTALAHTNAYAVVSIITVFLQPIAGIVFGHLALGQIKRNGDAGRGLALTGLIVGYAYVALIAMFVLFYLLMFGLMIAGLGAAFGDFGSGYYYDDPYSW